MEFLKDENVNNSTIIRDCGSNLYVGMRVVEMF